jgi:type IV secretion system protein VirB1
MLLELSAFLKIAAACAPQVAPETLRAVASVESGFDPLAINVNGSLGELHAVTRPQALRLARLLVDEQHRSVDLGLMQINAGNLQELGLTAEDALDPCQSLGAAGRLLAGGYLNAGGGSGEPPQQALRKALSIYNTGTMTRGFLNGYVRRVEAAAGEVQAELVGGAWRVPVTQAPLPTFSIRPPVPPFGVATAWATPWSSGVSNEPPRAESRYAQIISLTYAPSRPVRLLATPARATQIVFAPDERIESVTFPSLAGEPARWIASPTGNLLFIKPVSLGPLAEMQVTTTREDMSQRDYKFVLETQDTLTEGSGPLDGALSTYERVAVEYVDAPARPVASAVGQSRPVPHRRVPHVRSVSHVSHSGSAGLRTHRGLPLRAVFACLLGSHGRPAC